VNLASASSILVSGIVLGSLYAMMATGLSLVWSTLGIFNFAHGVFMALGAYLAWQVGNQAGFGLGAAAGIAFAVAALMGLGCLIERLLVRPFLERANLVMLVVITTLAALTFLENGMLLAWGPRFKQLDPLIGGEVSLLGVVISAHEALIILLAPTILLGLWLFLKCARLGTAIRAVGQNRDAALLMGMDVGRLYMLAFALSAGLAALAGILLGSIRFITPIMGNEPLVKALVVAIFGGLGSLAGTIGGAYIIGLLEATSVYFIGLYWTPAVLFMVMIAVLLIRPTGLFGAR
jgi:branched-chain amino acid transport system permease protein